MRSVCSSSAFASFVTGTVLGGRLARQLRSTVRRWLVIALGAEVVVLLVVSAVAGAGFLTYHGRGRLILIAALTVAFGTQAVTARQFGVQELSPTVVDDG